MGSQSERFSVDFMMGGVAAVVSKSAAAPIERVKLLLQNQGELLKRGQLKRPYVGVGDCFTRVLREEGVLSLWRGNQANVIRYFPTQVRFLALGMIWVLLFFCVCLGFNRFFTSIDVEFGPCYFYMEFQFAVAFFRTCVW